METVKDTHLDQVPQNGIKGLRHWKQDLLAGFVVSLISVSFNLAISLASGAPPIAGMISGIIAGLLVPFLGGSYVTICSCAAGLAPALYAGMTALGHGDRAVGYPILLCCIFFVGVIQVVLARYKMARLFMIFPTSMIHGMMCAIGLGILVKQIPQLMGVKFQGKGFFSILAEVPSHLKNIHPQTALISGVCLVTVFGLAALGGDVQKVKGWRKYMPIVAPIAATVAALCLSIGIGLSADQRVQLPPNLWEGITFPNWKALLDWRVALEAFKIVVVLTLIDGGESLATIAGVDKMDPFGRRSEANGTLRAMGWSNIMSSIFGGLTIIPGGIKSTACIQAGGRTQWANGYNAVFLLLYVLFLSSIINLIPLAGLAAVVCLMGWKLSKPSIWVKTWKIGKEQMLIFFVTVAGTLIEDLLVGIFAGIAVKLLVVLYMAKRTDGGKSLSYFEILKRCFRNPVKEVDAGVSYKQDGDYEIVLNGPVTCFNSRHLQAAFDRIPKDVQLVIVRCVPNTMLLLDHTSAENLKTFQEYFEDKAKRGVFRLEIEEGMNKSSDHALSLRVPMTTTPPPAPLATATEMSGSNEAAPPTKRLPGRKNDGPDQLGMQ